MRGLLTLKDLSTDKIKELIRYAEKLKKGFRIQYPDKKIVTMFFENSTRTHYSFQVALMNLGISVIDFDTKESSINKGESLYDTVRTFEALGVDGVIIRHSKDDYYKDLETIRIPIFNGGDGKANHPTQSLLDLMTIHEEFGKFEGLKCCIMGDISHSRVAHSNIEIMQRLGMEVYISGPEEFNDHSAKWIPVDQACKTMDVIMLLRIQFERHQEKMGMSKEEYHQRYGMTEERMKMMKDHAIIMHPAPINRGVEIADSVAECEKSRIYKQMTNGVYIRMAVISDALDGNL
ncbi:MAG: aspartate carbamoyltransferase catalytic subunit [Anaeroplasma sp.]|uniref:aspartate carbamoyltransferase catalytic subunit n=1 Tax=Anaeroplasma sp. TaxID=1872523 RepID=UPI002A915323|nr:aspartate carbamoyltransferase catalytic subunit [Anaeroplasma sp.]MDY5983618.1 aspartate carbamoyltransferase catalytic subunit [Anaeroplasma sp.]